MARKKNQARVVERDSKGRFLPGIGSPNPGGITTRRRGMQKRLAKALKEVESLKREDFLTHYIKQAYSDKNMAIALLKKLVPDLKAVEVDSQNREVWQIVLQNFGEKVDMKRVDSQVIEQNQYPDDEEED